MAVDAFLLNFSPKTSSLQIFTHPFEHGFRHNLRYMVQKVLRGPNPAVSIVTSILSLVILFLMISGAA